MSKNRSAILTPPLLDAAAVFTMEEAARILKTSKITLYRFIEDGALPTFNVGVRRYCTLAQIQQCVATLAERGANPPPPSAKQGPQYGRPSKKQKAQRGARV